MVKKKVKDNSSDDELSIPIPIQSFLWRQTSPFIRSRLTKLCEASCVSFERVIVQNILHGLSPSLCEAIQSIPRWKFIRASLPHVIHCCAAVLKNRSETNAESKFNSIEVKLLYTLHWIILDAASECEDSESGRQDHSIFGYLHSLDTIQLFVFLLIPLVSSLRRPDFENLKLENGLRLWEPLWNFQQPNVACFSAPVKMKHLHFKPQNEVTKVNFNMANIYLGQGTSSENLFPDSKDNESLSKSESRDTLSKGAPLVQMSEICALSNRNSMEESTTSMRISFSNEPGKSQDFNFNASVKPDKLPEEVSKPCSYDVISATYMDVAVLQCLFCPQWDEEGINWSLQYLLKRLTDIKLEITRIKRLKQLSQSMPNLELCQDNKMKSFPRKDSASVEALLASCSFPQATGQPPRSKSPSFRSPPADEGIKILFEGSTSTKSEIFGSYNSIPLPGNKKESIPTPEKQQLPDGKPQKPIITITCDNSKPPSSFSWPIKKVVEIVSESSKTDLSNCQHENLQRSLTDSKIHYTTNEDASEASGSTFYIQSDGQLKYSVVLLAIYNLSSRHLSSRVCCIVIDLINCFEDLNFFKKSHKDETDLNFRKVVNLETNNLDRSQSSLKKCKQSEDESMFFMTMDILFRVFRAMGCVHGCSDCSLKISTNLRGQVFECLEKLMEINHPLFKKYIGFQFIDQPLPILMECLHVLLGYCSDTINIYHMGGSKRESGYDFHSGLGYANNFGEPSTNMNSIQNRIIVLIWKKLLVKFVDCEKEILAHENIHLYHEIKQLVNYMKDNNGSTFRCVALSFLMDATKPFENHEAAANLKIDEEKDGHVFNAAGCPPFKSKSIFKKKTKKHSFPSHMAYTEAPDDAMPHHISPRASIFSIADDDVQFLAKKKSVRMFRGFHKSPKSDNEEDFSNGTTDPLMFAKGQRMSFKATGQATLRLLSARRKLEDGFKSFGRKHGNKRESICEGNLFGNGMSHAPTQFLKNSNLVREKKLINSYAIKSGLVRFNFLQEFCNPGSLPDAPLVAALLDLEAPVLGRAALLLECANFVNRCNKGDWPNWMKLSYGGHCSLAKNHSSQQSVSGRNVSVQKNAGMLFHQWAETLGNRLSEILIDENPDFYSFINKANDDGTKHDPRHGDAEENYMDEETVNQSGNECPYALKLVACQLLYEITAYLRETHQNLPTIKRQRYERMADSRNDPNRRWSSVFTPPESGEFHSSGRTQEGGGSDRKISFAVLDVTTRSDSMHSSTNSISQPNTNASLEPKLGRKSVISTGQKLLKARRGSDQNATFKHNRSFKVTHHAEQALPRVGSTKQRKVSTQSLHSANSTEETVSSSYAIFEEEETEEVQHSSFNEVDHSPGISYEDKSFGENMPWVKVVVQLANKSNFVCDHQNFCHVNCYERQRRSCTRMVMALRKVYTSNDPQDAHADTPSVKNQSGKSKNKDSTRTCHASNHHSSTKSSCSPDIDPEQLTTNKLNDSPLILKYLDTQVANLTHSPLAVIAKSAPILPDDIFIDIMPVAWELLLESDQELAAAAASVFLLTSIRVPEHMQELISYQFQHPDVSFRVGAILRFSILWNSRFQVWHRMEEGAHYHFKIPPPNIDFVLPSPTIGLSNMPTVDAPWLPHFKTKVEEVTINQKESKSLVTATTTRRKQQQQMINQALLAEEGKKRVARENCFMTSVPVCSTASIEPALLHSSEDHEDALQEELSLAVATRRMSVAVVNRASNVRNLSGRHGSVFFCRPMPVDDDDRTYPIHTNQMHLAQSFFPSSICQSAINIIQCLDDFEVNADGTSVSEVAEKIIWKCLVEDPALFLRTFLEKLTNKIRHKELIFLLRKLLFHVPILPSQAAHCLFNYLIGFVMFHVRSPSEGGLESINEALSVVWQVVPCVTGIYFKDLKQTLRKEQCDSTLLIAANVPSAKKLIVHGPDLSCIPSQFLIQEDTQFYHILQESLDFFNIPAQVQHEYFLVDTKTNHMHNMSCYVRDFYFFRRNFYPQLSLVKMDVEEAKNTLERQTFMLKFLEMEKVLFSLAVLNSSHGSQFQNHVNYLHEELLKLPSFPRKALETEFFTHVAGMKNEILQMDMLHKFAWAQLIATMFRGVSSTITHAGDLPLFLNVINGIIILHADDIFLLRHMIATYINVCRHFKQVFSMTGFSFILPTILKVYSTSHSNEMTNHAIKFMFRQFFLLHRNSFILQLFGIASSMLEVNNATNKTSDKKMETSLFYDLLVSMNEDLPDKMGILELMDSKQPIQALDFCYKDDPDTFSMLEAMNLCITVIAHSIESVRATQMLTILEAILPHFLKNVLCDHQKVCQSSPNDELSIINNLSILIKILVSSCESMTRFNRSQFEPNTKPLQGHLSQSPKPKKHKEDLGDFRFAPMEEGNTSQYQELVKPRNSVLSIASDFYLPCLIRSRELHNSDPSLKVVELIDHKSHIRLADIAHSLLKVSAHDPSTISCAGLQKYMTKVMPNTDWSQTSIRPALNLILRRLERFLNKIYKKMIPLNNLNWDAVTNLIFAINSTLANCSFIGHLPQMKTLVHACMHIVMGDDGLSNTGSSYSLPHRFESNASFKSICPLHFHGVSIKLALRLLFVLRESLESLCEASTSMYSSVEKLMNVIVNIIFPSSLELSNHKIKLDCMVPRKPDVMFCLSVILCALNPNFKHLSGRGEVDGRGLIGITSTHGAGSHLPPENFTKVVFLGLKMLMICFGKELTNEWHKIAKVIVQMVHNRMGGMELWSFMDFVISYRGPLFVLLLPLIRHRLTRGLPESSHKYHLVDSIRKKLTLYHASDKKSPSTILFGFAQEMIKLKDDNLSNQGFTMKTEVISSYPRDFDKLKQLETQELNDSEDLYQRNLAHSYKDLHVIRPTDGNLILNKYFKDVQNFRNVNEGSYDLENNSPCKDSDIDMHRLQRQDAKSRKTFKIKRHCTLNKSGILGGSILRSATVKGAAGQHRFQLPKRDEDHGSQRSMKVEQPELDSETKCASVQEVGESKFSVRADSTQSDPDASRKQTATKLHKQSVYRSRFMQKSKSHEDDAPAGTARGKIARQGLKNSQPSPVKSSENDVLLAKSESSESLKDEKSYLLDLDNPSPDVEADVKDAKTKIQ